ncbi:MAG TPA: MlaD family protein [Solirubrobacteraceae bacterium]|nr:MlaD family protein [Solirubrobacteraceae bacterium]
MARHQRGRGLAIAAVALAAVVLAVVVASAGSTYVLHADFADAGQLVSGDRVSVGGHQVGSVGDISLTRNGLADVQLNINDSSITPLRQGTIATIGQLSLTGVANRFVSLAPGPGAPIPSGGTLPETQTRGIVDLDTLLDAMTPRVRSALDGFLESGAYLVARPTASQLNSASAYLAPAASQTAGLVRQVAADDGALSQLVASTSRVAGALALPSTQLGSAVSSTAAALREVASQRLALEDSLARAPTVLRQATGVLGDVNGALPVIDPALVALRPVAARARALLRAVLPAAQEAVPTVRAVRALIPSAEAALSALPAAQREATPAISSLTSALVKITPILSGLRPYTPDVVAGFFNGTDGDASGAYDANGHYLQTEALLQGGGSSLTGLANLLSGASSGAPPGGQLPAGGERTELLAPCPGGGNAPAADGSNPWTQPDLLPGFGALCKPSDDQR